MTFKLRDGVSTADVEYGTALLDERQGLYWNLNASGALALRTLLGGQTAEQAAQALAEAYAIDLQTARHDVRELIDALRSADLFEH